MRTVQATATAASSSLFYLESRGKVKVELRPAALFNGASGQCFRVAISIAGNAATPPWHGVFTLRLRPTSRVAQTPGLPGCAGRKSRQTCVAAQSSQVGSPAAEVGLGLAIEALLCVAHQLADGGEGGVGALLRPGGGLPQAGVEVVVGEEGRPSSRVAPARRMPVNASSAETSGNETASIVPSCMAYPPQMGVLLHHPGYAAFFKPPSTGNGYSSGGSET